MKRWSIFIIVSAITATVIFGYIKSAHIPVAQSSDASLSRKDITIDSRVIHVEIADTDSTREKGLGGRSFLASDSGMLFIFEKDGAYPFWMKDMQFPIDIIWIASNGGVVDMYEDVTPETFPQTFSSRSPARYVLELAAHSVKRFNMHIGDIVRL